MSSGDKKNLLKSDNGSLRFGSNFEELMPGYQSPVPFYDIDLRVVKNAIAHRHRANELDREAAEHDPNAPAQDHDHVLGFFERVIKRISPQIEEARKKHRLQEDARASEELVQKLSASTEVISEEIAAIAAESLARDIAVSEFSFDAIMSDEEMGSIYRSLEHEGIRLQRPATPQSNPAKPHSES